MKDYLISCYIDDELDLDDKIEFVQTVHTSASYKDEAVDLLRQERALRGEVVHRVPSVQLPRAKRPFSISVWRPAGIFAAGLAAALLVLFLATPPQQPAVTSYRFVLYEPDVNQVEITGSFLGWQAVAMKKSGTSGYWEAVLKLPAGEHRLCYILEGGRRIPDPTIPIREKDDFGGENSILAVNLET